ncbi:MAG: hypothetical protein WB579_14580, partial [Bryobacteraceae bacterium]
MTDEFYHARAMVRWPRPARATNHTRATQAIAVNVSFNVRHALLTWLDTKWGGVNSNSFGPGCGT